MTHKSGFDVYKLIAKDRNGGPMEPRWWHWPVL